ncbi:hypothetical protein GLOTRDRAFT_12382, partial [Gloeophyllum trabeum ATCC 11539]
TPSTLRPNCCSDERIFLWCRINMPPPSTIENQLIRALADWASRASLRDMANYGAGLCKFHLFCDVFSIPEIRRLPASFELLHSFALWAPISVKVAQKYLSAVRAWHLAQGWSPPLSEEHMTRISWSLHGMANLQHSKRSRPPRPPVTLAMLAALKAALDLTDPFDACVWAAADSSFWGMMRFGEVSVKSRTAFDGSLHLKRADVFFRQDLAGQPYAQLALPSAKTAQLGQVQHVFLNAQINVCPLEGLRNLAQIIPDPLFSWRDRYGNIRPLVCDAALKRINDIFSMLGWGTAFGHSFRIGGASFFLAKKVDPEIMRLAGRWRSLAYETYIRAFEQI